MSNLKEVCGGNAKGSSGGGGAVGGAINALTEMEMKIKDNAYSVVSNLACLSAYVCLNMLYFIKKVT